MHLTDCPQQTRLLSFFFALFLTTFRSANRQKGQGQTQVHDHFFCKKKSKLHIACKFQVDNSYGSDVIKNLNKFSFQGWSK